MSRPLIVVTAGTRNPPSVPPEEEIIIGVAVDYLNAVVQAGGAPVLLPSVADTESILTVLRAADGMLLTGGGDILSFHYGEEPHFESQRHDPVRDAMEMTVVRTALKLNMPILGICRGLQLLNIVQGGTLYQDIPSQIPEADIHNTEELDAVLRHPIAIEPDTLLARIMQADTMEVNSWHHQSVNQLGRGLRINARARDGVVEGIESCEGKPVLAVQCHPEDCSAAYPCFRNLFRWLIDEAEAYHASKTAEKPGTQY